MPRVFTQAFVVVGALIEKEGKVILIRENLPGDPDNGKWSHPAGWVEPGENPLESVKREVKEETGCEFEPTHLIGIYSLVREDLKNLRGAAPHAVKLIFGGDLGDYSANNLLGDTHGGKWFSPEEIFAMDKKTLRDPDIKKIVKDHFSGACYPLAIVTHTISPPVG